MSQPPRDRDRIGPSHPRRAGGEDGSSESLSPSSSSDPSEVSTKKLLGLAWPILIPLFSQNLRLLVDTAFVGHLGVAQLASLGLMGFFSLLLMTPLLSLNGPVQAVVARARGESNPEAATAAIRAAVGWSVLAGTVYGVIVFVANPYVVDLVTVDPAVRVASLNYIQPIVVSLPFAGLASAFYGYWNASERPRVNLWVELTMQISNLVLAYLLIFGRFGFPELGIAGAGIAFGTSTVIGAILHLAVLADFRAITPMRWIESMRAEVALSNMTWHNMGLGFQNTIAFFIVYLIVQAMGTLELAAFTVLFRFATMLIYPAQALGTATATLAGRAIGEEQFALAGRWAICAIKVGAVATAVAGIPFWLLPHPIVASLTGSEEIARIADLPLRVLGVTIVFSGVGFVLSATLVGTGAASRARKMNLLSLWVFGLPAALLVGPVLGLGLLAVWLSQAASRLLAALLLWRSWDAWRRADFPLGSG